MRRINQLWATVFLAAAIAAPTGAPAMLATRDGQELRGQEEQENRVYDPAYKDYHVWDAREEEAYRRWLDEQREPYVFHGQISERTQKDYWKWRHKDLKRAHREHAEREHP